MKSKHYNRTWEHIKWWLYSPRFELIYLLGGTPDQHQNVLHYRNIERVVANLQKLITTKGKE